MKSSKMMRLKADFTSPFTPKPDTIYNGYRIQRALDGTHFIFKGEFCIGSGDTMEKAKSEVDAIMVQK